MSIKTARFRIHSPFTPAVNAAQIEVAVTSFIALNSLLVHQNYRKDKTGMERAEEVNFTRV